jgi:hypothetical protein
MGSRITIFVTGIIVGSICWTLDPFNGTGSRIYIVQIILSVTSIYIGYKKGAPLLLVYVFGAYLGMFLSGFESGGIEQLGWALLAMFMLSVPLFLPLTLGVIAGLVKASRSKNTSSNE